MLGGLVGKLWVRPRREVVWVMKTSPEILASRLPGIARCIIPDSLADAGPNLLQ